MHDYVAVADDFKLPPGMNFGGVSGVAINSKGHIFLLHRGPMPLMEFDADGNFIRSYGDGMFERPHGLRIDARGQHLGDRRRRARGLQDQSAGPAADGARRQGPARRDARLRPPAAVQRAERGGGRPNGDIYVLQGHGKGSRCVIKFDKDGNFIKTWGKKGTGPGEFDLPHSIVIDAQGLLYIADRNNARIQVFDADGNYMRESKHPGTPCGLFMTPDQHIFMAHGHTGMIMKLDLDGKVLGARPARQGKTLGKYGEAHYIAVSARDEIFVADTLNWRVQKYVKR